MGWVSREGFPEEEKTPQLGGMKRLTGQAEVLGLQWPEQGRQPLTAPGQDLPSLSSPGNLGGGNQHPTWTLQSHSAGGPQPSRPPDTLNPLPLPPQPTALCYAGKTAETQQAGTLFTPKYFTLCIFASRQHPCP